MEIPIDRTSSVGLVVGHTTNRGIGESLPLTFVFPDTAIPTGTTCEMCREPALYVLPDSDMFSNKIFCASCETCWLCEENSSHHEKFCTTCFCADCGYAKNSSQHWVTDKLVEFAEFIDVRLFYRCNEFCEITHNTLKEEDPQDYEVDEPNDFHPYDNQSESEDDDLDDPRDRLYLDSDEPYNDTWF